MAHSRPSGSPLQTNRTRAFRVLLGLVYLLALAGLTVWEYRDQLDLGSTGCEPGPAESKSALQARASGAGVAEQLGGGLARKADLEVGEGVVVGAQQGLQAANRSVH